MTLGSQLLIVDDDDGITSLLADYLTRYGYVVHVAGDGASMQRQMTHHAIDLVVLDVMLPGPDGLSLARTLRQHSVLPIIMLTARSSAYDRVLGLENGADDYMSKPFEPRELVARIQSVLRRMAPVSEDPPTQGPSDVICFDGWELHGENRCLYAPDGLVVALSNAEFRLLFAFLHAPRRLLSRDHLLEKARGHAMDSLGRSIDLLVSRLRQKLAHTPQGPGMIKTMRGVGYMFNVQSVQGRAHAHQRPCHPLGVSGVTSLSRH